VKGLLLFLLTGLLMSAPASSPRAAELVMFESAGCEWCEVWDEEVGVVYNRTDEGRVAPLRRVDIYETRPQDLSALKAVHFTPTFVLFDDNREVGRIVGYPGESFFWQILDGMISKLPISKAQACAVGQRIGNGVKAIC
jgi:thioredoxin-related protein